MAQAGITLGQYATQHGIGAGNDWLDILVHAVPFATLTELSEAAHLNAHEARKQDKPEAAELTRVAEKLDAMIGGDA